MKLYKLFETIIGFSVIIVFVIFGSILLKRTDTFSMYKMSSNSYDLYFRVAYGINKGSLVKVKGVAVGYVNSILLTNNNQAKVTVSVDKDVKIPDDSLFSVLSQGLTGGQYIDVSLGSSKEYLKNKDIVENTQDYQSLEDKIGEIISNLVQWRK